MKQTNNAIKFLMAQYRAIFRNANLKMFLAAATAAAALSAGQAQAAKALDESVLKPLTSGDTFTLNGDTNATGDKNTYTNLKLEVADQGADIVIKQNHTFDVTGGSTTSGSSFDNKGTDAKKITLASSTLNITSSKTAADTVVKVGASNAVSVEFGTINVNKGTLDIAKGSIAAGSISLGKAPTTDAGDGANTKAAGDNAIVIVSGGASIGNKETTKFGIYEGSDLQLKGPDSKAVAKKTITLNGGKITVDAAATGAGATIDSELDMQSGSVSVEAAGILNVAGAAKVSNGTITLNGGSAAGTLNLKGGLTQTNGTIDVKTDADKAGALTVTGKTSVTGGKFKVGSGATVTLNGDASFAKETLELNADGKLAFGTFTGSGTRTLTVDSTAIKGALAKAGAITGTGGADDTFVLKLSDDEVNLLDAKIVKESTGAAVKGDGIALTGAKLAIQGNKATLAKGSFNDATSYDFNTFEVGDSKAFEIKGGAKVTVHNAISDAKGANLTTLKVSSGDLVLSADEGASGSVGADTLNLEGSAADQAKLLLTGGNWSVNNLTLTKGQATVNGGLKLGDKLTVAAGSKVTVDGGYIDALGSGSLALDKADDNALELKNGGYLKLDGDDILNKDSALDDTKIKGTAIKGGGSESIEIDNATALTKEQFETLRDTSLSNFTGIIKFTKPVDIKLPEGDLTLQNIVHGTDSAVYNQSTLNVKPTETIDKTYSVGNVLVGGNTNLQMAEGGNLFLNKAETTTGAFVSNTGAEGKKDVAGVDFKGTNNSLTFADTGKIGAITTANDGKGSVLVGKLSGKDTVTPGHVTVVKGNDIGAVGAKLNTVGLKEGSSLTVESGSIYSINLDVADKSTLKVVGDITAQDAQVDGTLESTGVFSLTTAGVNNFSSANVKVGTLKLASGVKVNIGNFDKDNSANDATGSVYASSLELAGGSVFIDPNSKMPYSVLAVNTLTGGVVEDVNAGTLTGKVNVGNNGVFGVGFKDKADLTGYLAKYTNEHGGLDPTKFSSALVLNKQITLAATDGIYVGSDAKDNSASGNDLIIKSDAALVVSDDVFTVDRNGKKTGAAISTEANATVNVTDAKLVLIGDFSAADDSLEIIKGATTVIGKFNLASANGLLTGSEVDGSQGTYKLSFSRENANKLGAFADASAPVREILFKKLEGNVKGEGAGIELLADGATASLSGAVPDAAYHAATYAGAQQAAVAAVGTMAEAVGARVGSMGVEAATIAATGSQANGGVWLTPMYKSVDADGFNAEGASYGADVDLAGVAFGTDTVNGNMRFGAVFNIGSGDADGKGNGNGLKDEFDYYGFGIYSVMGFGNLALVGDASLNVISHDVKHDALGLAGSADTTAVTMGITGQYTIANPMVDVTPHLGARFIRLDTDSYDLKQAGEVLLNTDFDVQNVFSIPLGVSLSKAFEMGGWSLAPSADLSITFNTGDTEVKSSVTVPNTTGANASLTTEVLDEVTYGVAVGLGAQYGAFGTQIGINYTGSENTDAFGVNAQARYMF